MSVLHRPPEITVYRSVAGISRPFRDDNSLINAASMGDVFSTSPAVHYVEQPRPCEALFRYWAEYEPDQLLAAMQPGVLAPHDLTFAAEAAGRIADPSRAIPVLLGLLSHESALVREGVIYGLAPHSESVLVAAHLASIAVGDSDEDIRQMAQEALE